MNYIKNDLLDEGYYEIDHSSGLKIYVYPKPGYTSAYAVFGTRYGSIDTRFKRSDRSEYTEIPPGTAHFLEHKLFESEELDAFQRYAKTGASANAYTSFDRTCYLFSCTGHFKENFEILLDFVRHPYFTAETVKKEQGIIGQEIDMYKDLPDWECLFRLLEILYHKHPVKIDIAGTRQSISEITAPMLFSCYDTFYNLSNMALAVAGNVTVEEVLEVADRLLTADERVTVERVFEDEPKNIVADYTEKKLTVETPMFTFGYKESHDTPERSVKEEIIKTLILELIAGTVSPFYKECLDKGLINDTFATEYFNGHGYAVPLFSGESTEPKKVASLIKERVALLKQTGIPEAEFETVRKKQFGKTVRAFSDIDTIANGLIVSFFDNEDLYAEFRVLQEITLDEINTVLRESFLPETAALSVITPIKE